MYKKVYYAEIESVSIMGPLEHTKYLDRTPERLSIAEVDNDLIEHNWVVGTKYRFKYYEVKDNGEFTTRHKTLPIKSIRYFTRIEKTITETKELSPDNNFKESPSKNKVMLVDYNVYHDNNLVKTYTIATNGSDYMQRLDNYRREHGIVDEFDEHTTFTISNIWSFNEKTIVI